MNEVTQEDWKELTDARFAARHSDPQFTRLWERIKSCFRRLQSPVTVEVNITPNKAGGYPIYLCYKDRELITCAKSGDDGIVILPSDRPCKDDYLRILGDFELSCRLVAIPHIEMFYKKVVAATEKYLSETASDPQSDCIERSLAYNKLVIIANNIGCEPEPE